MSRAEWDWLPLRSTPCQGRSLTLAIPAARVPDGWTEIQIRATTRNFEPGFLVQQAGTFVLNYVPTGNTVNGRKEYQALGTNDVELIVPSPGLHWHGDDDPDAFQLESLDPSPWEWPQAPAGIEDQPAWQAPELQLDDERILVLDGD